MQKVDPRGNKVVRTTAVAGSPRFLAVGEDGVWTLSQLDGSITRIDPRTNRVAERYGPELGDGSVIVGFGAVWISVVDADTLWRLPLRKR